jgi:hypothetical protein
MAPPPDDLDTDAVVPAGVAVPRGYLGGSVTLIAALDAAAGPALVLASVDASPNKKPKSTYVVTVRAATHAAVIPNGNVPREYRPVHDSRFACVRSGDS